MKKHLIASLTFAILFGSHYLSAQRWTQNIHTPRPNFFEIQKAFNDYYKEAGTDEENGRDDEDYEKFKRWEWYWEQRVNQAGEFPASSVIWDEWNNYNTTHPQNADRSSSGNWSFAGPSTTPGGLVGLGRVNCMAFHPTNANIFWVGTPAGGLWKTTDGGSTWATNTDGLPVLGVSDIALDPTNSSNIYIATGDGELGALGLLTGDPSGDTKSIGILKSTNGGATWNTTGLNPNVSSGLLIRRLIINPGNPQILIAATNAGIFRTTNGGTNWTNVQIGYFMDLEFKPGDPTIVYAASASSAGNAQIYRSTNSGASWASVASPPDAGRINLAVTPNSTGLVSALFCNTQGGLGGLWYSNNSGATFTPYSLTPSCSNDLLSGSYPVTDCGTQGFYDLAHAINPNNWQEMWVGGVNSWKTSNGGVNWSIKNYWDQNFYNLPVVHADKHFYAYHPLNANIFFECNDGGLYKTTNGGSTWTDLSNGLQISQIYRIGVSQTNVSNVICGLQDNGTRELYNSQWYQQIGGDGMECLIDYSNAAIEYGTYTNGLLFRTYDSWGSSDIISDNIPGMINFENTYGRSSGAWVTPFVIHPTNPQILYAGYHDVWKTADRGDTWTQISNFNLANDPYGTDHPLQSIAVAPSNPNKIYTATFDTIFVTSNGGTNWAYHTLGVQNANITYIAVSSTDPQTVWITLSGYVAGQKVYKSTNGGANWTNISGTLPNLPVNCIVYQAGSGDGLYIGTDVGVFYRDGSMADWVHFNTGMPNVVVTELEISYNDNKLWAATFGRGLWQSDLYSLTAPVASFTVSDASTCQNACITFTDHSVGNPTSWAWSFPGGTPSSSAAQNPSICYPATGTYNVSLTVTNAVGSNTTTQTNYIVVNSNPHPTIAAQGNTTFCAGNNVSITVSQAYSTYTWSNGTSGNTALISTSGNYSVTVSDGNGCSGTSNTVPVVVNPKPVPVISASGLTTLCPGQTVTLYASQGYSSYLWNNGVINSSQLVNASGSFTVTVTDNNNCSGSSNTVNVTTNSNPIPSISTNTGSTTICQGQSVTINVNASYISYLWNNGVINSSLLVNSAGAYSVTVTDNNNCSGGSNTIQITVDNPTPPTIAQNGYVLTANYSNGLQWYLAGQPINGATQQTLTVTQSGSYTVAYTDNNGCSATSNSVIVNYSNVNEILRGDLKVYPNPAKNKLFVQGEFLSNNGALQVYNSIGQLLIEQQLQKGNQQIINIEVLPRGIYYVRIAGVEESFVKE